MFKKGGRWDFCEKTKGHGVASELSHLLQTPRIDKLGAAR